MSVSPPRHIAIIMDGNGRWAERRGHGRVFGHVRGSSRVKGIVREASRLGVKALTLYAFSTENWSRPESEVKVLWRLLRKFVLREADELNRSGVRLRVIGEVERLDPDVRLALEEVTERLSGNTGLHLTLAISYGARRELVRAASLFAQDCVAGKRQPEDMSDGVMREYLWTATLDQFEKDLGDVDLLIRTGGELRVSNFLLWQSAYAELYFTERCWPDFGPQELAFAVEHFMRRDRRFGSVPPTSYIPEKPYAYDHSAL